MGAIPVLNAALFGTIEDFFTRTRKERRGEFRRPKFVSERKIE